MRRHAKVSLAGSTTVSASSATSYGRKLYPAVVAIALFGLAFVPTAAAAPPVIWEAGAETFATPRGVAANPDNGHVFVADQGSKRVVELSAWGSVVKTWGWDVVASGPGDDTTAPINELEVCVPADGDVCKAGVGGNGTGQLNNAMGVALDSERNVYVIDATARRVQKFSPTGQFLLMFGGGVNETSGGNVCPRPGFPADVCKAGTTGAGSGQFGTLGLGSYIGVATDATPSAADDKVYVGEVNRIQRFDAAGTVEPAGQITTAKTVQALSVDAAGSLYVAYLSSGTNNEPNVRKLNPTTGSELCTFTVANPRAVSVAPDGDVYAFDKASTKILRFDPACGEPVEEFGEGLNNGSTGLAANAVTAAGDVAVYFANASPPFLRAYSPVPDTAIAGPPPSVPPTIGDQWAASVDTDSAVVQAQINPRFWADTSYYVQYGTEECVATGWESACVVEQPDPPGTQLGAGQVDADVTTSGILLSGLQPDTAYTYRFVAQSGGGGPVFGADRAFTTFTPPPSRDTTCPNQIFRTGPSAYLPDCRAYEMVSPIDKNDGDIMALVNLQTYNSAVNQSSISGQKLTYSAYKAFGDSVSAPYASQYVATRGADGWTSDSISPPKENSVIAGPSNYLTDAQFKAFSPDLSDSWLWHESEPLLAPGAAQGFVNFYKRNGADGSYEALTTATPPNQPSGTYRPELLGISGDGNHAVFSANDSLTSDAAPTPGLVQLYESVGGELRLVSFLPDETPSTQSSSAGTRNGGTFEGRSQSVDGAVSFDGSRIFFTTGPAFGPGKIYVRIDGSKTVAVSPSVSNLPARFWKANPEGNKAIFTIRAGATESLYEFDVESETPTLIAPKVLGLAGVSDDASRIYFVSTESLAPGATAGQPNLYLAQGGTTSFVATLASGDVTTNTLSLIAPEPVKRSARVTPDGRHLAFLSEASLTGYDNTDLKTGEPDTEVFLYDADEHRLRCISCNPSGARPAGRLVDEAKPWKEIGVAARFSTWGTQFYQPRSLSDDGNRLFFESFEALVSRDTNGKQDVYEWTAPGSGGCQEPEGCIDLISSGESPQDSYFVDASPTGDDVFITTNASLVSQDPGLIDVYDARAGGGFPPPPGPTPPCEGQACQSPSSPPNDRTPASATFRGAANPTALDRSRARRCPRGERKVRRGGKARCVRKTDRKDQRRHQKRKQRRDGRAGR